MFKEAKQRFLISRRKYTLTSCCINMLSILFANDLFAYLPYSLPSYLVTVYLIFLSCYTQIFLLLRYSYKLTLFFAAYSIILY